MSKKRKLFVILILCIIPSVFFISCQDENITNDTIYDESISLRSIQVSDLDWENVDWMPTPPGQTKISPPWFGQGSLSSSYGLEIINDNKKSDGWVLLYNTFTSTGSQLINPYFILYNKYRGIMRIYLYLTTSFVASSSYLQDGLSVTSTTPTCLLNYLGDDLVDVAKKPNNYMQMQAAPSDGSLPLASNKWYMLQYELAYDSSLANTSYKDIQLSWIMNYYNVTKVDLGGDIVGKLTGTIGSASSSNIFSSLLSLGKTVGTGAVAAVGSKVLLDNKIDDTGKNKLGLPNIVFKEATSGISKAINNAASSAPKDIVNLLSAIVGGSSSGITPISLDLNATISLTGTASDGGSFPSSPTSMWVPGTLFTSSTQGYIPYYNKPLGVMYLSSKPHITTKLTQIETEYETPSGDPMGSGIDRTYEFPKTVDYSNYLVINPEVLKIANVNILKQDLVIMHQVYSGGPNGTTQRVPELNPTSVHLISDQYRESEPRDSYYNKIGVRFTIRISPKDGSPSSDIYKTFELSEDIDATYYYYRSLIPA